MVSTKAISGGLVEAKEIPSANAIIASVPAQPFGRQTYLILRNSAHEAG
jgi:hypothetical protein